MKATTLTHMGRALKTPASRIVTKNAILKRKAFHQEAEIAEMNKNSFNPIKRKKNNGLKSLF